MTKPKDYELHEFCAAFPELEAKDLQDLADDIYANGLRHPIILFEDKILDGRNRYLACKIHGVEPEFEEFQGPRTKALDFVVSENLARRHLSTAEKAFAAARLSDLRGTKAQDEAEHLKVSSSSARRAEKIIDKAIPAIQEAAEKGDITLFDAAKLADKPAEVQEKVARSKDKDAAAKKAVSPPVQPLKTIMTKDDKKVLAEIVDIWNMDLADMWKQLGDVAKGKFISDVLEY